MTVPPEPDWFVWVFRVMEVYFVLCLYRDLSRLARHVWSLLRRWVVV